MWPKKESVSYINDEQCMRLMTVTLQDLCPIMSKSTKTGTAFVCNINTTQSVEP